MNQPPRPFFTVTDIDSLSVTTALIHGDTLTIATDDHSLSLPTLIALDIAAETIRLLLDEDAVRHLQAPRPRAVCGGCYFLSCGSRQPV